jgi:hypothetical protein
MELFLKFAQSNEWDEKEPFRSNEIFQISVDLEIQMKYSIMDLRFRKISQKDQSIGGNDIW